MNGDSRVPESILDAQVQRLLDIVEDYRKSQSDSLLGQAQQESREIVRQAWRDARQRLREAVQEARQQLQNELAAARAKQHTAMMQQRHRADLDFLQSAWSLLAEKLQKRWDMPESRREWVARVLADAMKTVPGRDWLIEYPEGWPEEEQQRVRDEMGGDRRLQFTCLEGMTAGIRVATEGAVVDGSLQGLMADRSSIEALLLARRPEGGNDSSRREPDGPLE